jgi:L-methionine (R)-S-oxide reductase
LDKQKIYQEILAEIAATLEGEADLISRMSTACSILKERLPWASWVGFYRLTEPDLLTVGPYQGGIGCLRIPITRGVCGAAARTGITQIVPDVHVFEGHIACDPTARSEIVIPVRDRSGPVFAVLDLDSRLPSAFDEYDRLYLEEVTKLIPSGTRS